MGTTSEWQLRLLSTKLLWFKLPYMVRKYKYHMPTTSRSEKNTTSHAYANYSTPVSWRRPILIICFTGLAMSLGCKMITSEAVALYSINYREQRKIYKDIVKCCLVHCNMNTDFQEEWRDTVASGVWYLEAKKVEKRTYHKECSGTNYFILITILALIVTMYEGHAHFMMYTSVENLTQHWLIW